MVYPNLAYLNSLPEWTGKGGFGLGNISKVLRDLGDPQDRVRAVHVAGTNGKGSVSTAVAAMLGASGARVGLTTSPHLEILNERIVIDGLPVSDDAFDQAAKEVFRASKQTVAELTFFEAVIACAYWLFAEMHLDWMVIETGLGGRLDATNVIKKPEVASIVTIDFDHENILGPSLLDIAGEKAGIIKPNSVLITGELTQEVFEKIDIIAKHNNVPHWSLGRDFMCRAKEDGSERIGFFQDNPLVPEFEFVSPLVGRHQLKNMAVALKIAILLGLNPETCLRGLGTMFWPGRLERLPFAGQVIFLDCAHNPAGIREALAYLGGSVKEKLRVGFGVFADKHWREMVESLIPHTSEWNLLTPHSVRALSSSLVKDFLSSNGISAFDFQDDYNAFLSHIHEHNGAGPVLICGSVYLLGSIRSALKVSPRPLWRRGG